MTDNVVSDPGTGGATFATDEITSVHYPITKITFGALDSQTIASSGSGVVDAGTQRVILPTDHPAIPVTNGGTFAVQVDGINGTVDANNSTSTPLGIGATFTGTSTDILQFTGITISVYSDVASGTDGLSIEFSTDGTNWDHTDVFTIPLAEGKTFSFQPVARYMRVLYTNGGGAQSAFRLSTILKTQQGKSSSHRVADAISTQDDVEVVKAVLTGENPSNDFVNFQATAAGNFKVALEESNGALTGAGTEATAIRVTVATDSTGLLSVDDNGGSLTVDNAGTFAVQADSVIPGTGATNLGKAIDSVAGATDTGIAMLGIHQGDTVHSTTAEGDYEVVRLSAFGAMQVEPEQHHVFDTLDVTTGWAAFNNDTTTLATTAKHVLGAAALSFNKVDGAANTVFGMIDKTITSVDLGMPSPHDILQTVMYVSSTADIDYVLVRVGTDNTNYNEWRIDGLDLTSGIFETLAFQVGDASHTGITGNGIDWSAVTYIAVGFALNAETDTLAGIIFDEMSFHTNQHVNASINSEVTSSVSSANVNLQKVGGSATDKNSGNKSNGSQRVVLATDDINTAAIKAAVEGAQPAGTNLMGDVGIGVRTSGGTTLYKNIDVDETEDQVKATAGQVYWIHAINATAAIIYLKVYNATAASVTVGTTVPDLTFPVPGNSTTGAGFTISIPNGIEFTTAITIAATTGVADADSGAPAANALIVNLGYN